MSPKTCTIRSILVSRLFKNTDVPIGIDNTKLLMYYAVILTQPSQLMISRKMCTPPSYVYVLIVIIYLLATML